MFELKIIGRTIGFSCLLLNLVNCTTSNELESPASGGSSNTELVRSIHKETILPDKFVSKKAITVEKEIILVPKIMLNLASITRSKAELRDGPGTEFMLQNKILEKESLVVVFNKKGSWTKVYDYESGITGWLHEKTLAKVSPDPYNLKFQLDSLPTVMVLKKIKKVYSYPQEERLSVSIRKGTQFVALKKTRWMILVWISETNSVMWISRKEAV